MNSEDSIDRIFELRVCLKENRKSKNIRYDQEERVETSGNHNEEIILYCC